MEKEQLKPLILKMEQLVNELEKHVKAACERLEYYTSIPEEAKLPSDKDFYKSLEESNTQMKSRIQVMKEQIAKYKKQLAE